jgi:hypothetical protein
VNDAKEPTAKAEACWDDDTLTSLGFTNIGVGGTGCDTVHGSKHQGMSFAEAKWKVHGVRGTNSLKTRKKSETTSKPNDVIKPPTTKMDENLPSSRNA